MNAPSQDAERGEPVCVEQDGCPTEIAVLQRFWRAHRAPAAQPVAYVAEVHMSRYTIEWTNGPRSEGTALYAAQPACSLDPQLAKFYDAETVPQLITAMEHHVLRLQEKLKAVTPTFSFSPQRVREG